MLLALGVGATTALFSVVNGVLLAPLSFRDPGRLVLVGEQSPQMPAASERFAFIDTPSAFLAWRGRATDFSGLAAIQSSIFTLAAAGRPQELHGARVSADFFDLLGARPQLGRGFEPGDETDPTRPMVITDALWRSAFHADPSVIGRSIGVPGSRARIIGVLPREFRLAGAELGPMLRGESTQYFVTLHFGPHQGGNLAAVWSNFNYTVLGRIRPDISLAQALAQLNVIQADLARSAPDPAPGMTLLARVMPVRDYAVSDARQELWLLLAGVAAVLLIVCVNLGGLWTSRIADRRRDWAIRAALGAAPGRLARQVLREGVVLSLIGGAVGIGCAAASQRVLLAFAPAGVPRLDEVHFDWRVLGFGFLLALAAGAITALVPALRLARGNPQAYLKASGSSTTADRGSLRSRNFLIATQAALSTLLLAIAGLLGLSFYRLMTRPAGFAAEHALEANVVVNTYSDAQRDRIIRELPGTVEAIPGVAVAGITSHLPLQGEIWIDGAGVPGHTYPAAEQPTVNVRFIGPGYFAAVGIPLLAGRNLRESDRPAGWPPKDDAAAAAMPGVVVISRTTARMLWPGASAREIVGRKMKLNDRTPLVVGVAADALDGTLTTAAPSVVYQPYWAYPPDFFALVVRSSLPPAALAGPLRSAIWKLAPDAPIPALRPLRSLRANAVAPQRYQLTLLLLFAGLALSLAALGVYALVAHSVLGRAKEIAIRRTLGARAEALAATIVARGLGPVAGGIAAGLIAAVVLGRLLQSLLFGVGAFDPAVLAAVAMLVLAAAAAACALPARRAIRADPWPALRGE